MHRLYRRCTNRVLLFSVGELVSSEDERADEADGEESESNDDITDGERGSRPFAVERVDIGIEEHRGDRAERKTHDHKERGMLMLGDYCRENS